MHPGDPCTMFWISRHIFSPFEKVPPGIWTQVSWVVVRCLTPELRRIHGEMMRWKAYKTYTHTVIFWTAKTSIFLLSKPVLESVIDSKKIGPCNTTGENRSFYYLWLALIQALIVERLNIASLLARTVSQTCYPAPVWCFHSPGNNSAVP